MNDYAGNETAFGYSEATATWATRYIDPSGFECILTLQAESGAEALKKAESAIAHLTEAKCIPFHKESHTTGNKDNGNNPGKTVLVKADGDGKNPICPLHGVEMKRWSKGNRSWHAHRWEDGWCQGYKRNE